MKSRSNTIDLIFVKKSGVAEIYVRKDTGTYYMRKKVDDDTVVWFKDNIFNFKRVGDGLKLRVVSEFDELIFTETTHEMGIATKMYPFTSDKRAKQEVPEQKHYIVTYFIKETERNIEFYFLADSKEQAEERTLVVLDKKFPRITACKDNIECVFCYEDNRDWFMSDTMYNKIANGEE